MPRQKTTTPKWGGRIWLKAFVLPAIFALVNGEVLAAPASAQGLPAVGGKAPGRPWGELEYQSISLEPDELFLDGAKPPATSRWFFENFSRAQLWEFLNSCELTETQKAPLLRTNEWETLTNGCAIFVPNEVALGLGHAARQRIYPVLARTPANYAQYFPFRFPVNGFDQRFADSGVSPETLELIRGLTYTNEGFLCFSAMGPLRSVISTNELRALVKALYRTPTWIVNLRVTPESDLAALAKYWGKGGREKTVRPLLQSLARVKGGVSINVSQFFPAFARECLYTYPDPLTDPAGATEDCFYTSLNFFKEQPDARFLDNRNIGKALQTEYDPVEDQPVFGDLLALVDAKGAPVHICVYVADDIVFTKNGGYYLHPWILMKIRDMIALFPSERPLRVAHFRRRSSNTEH